MKKTFIIRLLLGVSLFALGSCSKTGPTGPAGPLSTGTLTGFITIYDQYGFKVPGDISGVTVNIPSIKGDSVTTNASGSYTISNLSTGVYNLVYSRTGCGTVLANNASFLGGGTIYRNQTMSLIPSFSLFNVYDTIETYLTDLGILIKGKDTINGVNRQYIIFAGTSSGVSSAPGAYQYNSAVQTIRAGSGSFSAFLTSQELADAGLIAGNTAYFIVYPYAVNQPTYIDPATGKTVYTALGKPSQVFAVLVP